MTSVMRSPPSMRTFSFVSALAVSIVNEMQFQQNVALALLVRRRVVIVQHLEEINAV